MKNYSRTASFVIVAVVYVLALAVGILSYLLLLPLIGNAWLTLFAADALATVFTWAAGLLYRNVSVYDPYWSVAPPVMFTIWLAAKGSFSVSSVLLLVAVWWWAIRLTGNWAVTFKGLAHEDWRYTKYRAKGAFLFHVINFFGLNMVPTIVVFLAMLPGFAVIEGCGSANWLTFLAFAVCVASACIQLVADTQSHRFRREHPGEVCNVGLWKNGRHPNYFGEVQMWWGVWLLYASVAYPHINWWLIGGAVANTLLFLFISIPMMEKRQLKNKPAYAEYRKNTRLFI